jgi:hypothetical protein
VAFAFLITIGTVFAYSRGMRPAIDYLADRRSRFTRRQLWGTIVRAVGYTAAALICGALVHRVARERFFAIRVGLVTGIVTGVGATVNRSDALGYSALSRRSFFQLQASELEFGRRGPDVGPGSH